MSDRVQFILTGGTIEKAYDPTTEKPEFRHGSIVPEYLNNIVKLYPHVNFEEISQIDSLDMTDEIRERIVRSIEKSDCERVVIVHGTSTMSDTAEYLSRHLTSRQKTVILTGAMIPLKEFAMSDAGFNLGYALAKVQDTPGGVYLAMNAKLFAAGQVQKNTSIGRFEAA